MIRLLLAAGLLLAANAAQAQVKIGLSAPLTGPDAAFGQGMRMGAEQAVADLNRAGGVNGQRLVLVVADDAGDARQGLAVVKKLAAERVSLVVGPLNAAVAASAMPAYAEAGIVAVTPGSGFAPLTARGLWNVFRTCANEAEQGALAGAYLADTYAGRRIGLVHDRTGFGRGLTEDVARVLKARGQREAAFETLTRGDRDFSDMAGRLARAGVDAVYFGGLALEAAHLAKALRAAGSQARLVGSEGLLDKDFPANAGPAAEGTVMTLAPDPRRLPETKGPNTAAKPAPRPPEAEVFAAQSYAAVEVLRLGVEGARTVDGPAVAAFLHRGAPLRTILGDLAYDARGDLAADAKRPGYILRVWQRTPDGRIDYAGHDPAP